MEIGYWEDLHRGGGMERSGKDGDCMDIGRIWIGAGAWKEEERMESGYWEDLERSE